MWPVRYVWLPPIDEHMPKDLDLCILALVDQGAATPYDLKVKAGLSLGSTIPTLQRLLNEGLIKGANPDLRNSRKYSPMGKGKAALRRGWSELVESRPTDLDTISRIAYLACGLAIRNAVRSSSRDRPAYCSHWEMRAPQRLGVFCREDPNPRVRNSFCNCASVPKLAGSVRRQRRWQMLPSS